MRHGVDQITRSLRIARENFRQWRAFKHDRFTAIIADDVAVLITGNHLTRDQIANRCSTTTLTGRKEADHHG